MDWKHLAKLGSLFIGAGLMVAGAFLILVLIHFVSGHNLTPVLWGIALGLVMVCVGGLWCWRVVRRKPGR